jgi:hypothetical protein
MTKLLISAAALITLLAVTDAAFAAGASRFAPGRETRMSGTHGASFNAPGRIFLRHGHVPRNSMHPGASGWAPGREFR